MSIQSSDLISDFQSEGYFVQEEGDDTLSLRLPDIPGLHSPIFLSHTPFPQADGNLIQFTYLFPDSFQCQHLLHLFRYINLVNKTALLSGMGYDEFDQTAFFRYSLPVQGTPRKEDLFTIAKQLIQQVLAYQGFIQAISEGLTFEKLIEEVTSLVP